MGRTDGVNHLDGPEPGEAGNENVVAGPPALDDHLRVQLPPHDHPAGQPGGADKAHGIEPPIILAMTRKEASLLIDLLNLSEDPKSTQLLFRLCAKYVQTFNR